MSWDPIWEQIFSSREWGKYPPEELIRFTARNFYGAPDRKAVKILELGCGPGAEIWYLAREGFDAYGVEGSATAIRKAEQRLEQEGLGAHLQVGDVNELARLYQGQRFDAVIDVGCLVCNKMQEIRNIVGQAYELLKPGGKLFSMVLATGTCGYGVGRQIEPGTFVDINEGPLADKGLIHFFTLEEAQDVFGRFADLRVDYSDRSADNRRYEMKHWVVEGSKSA